MTANVAIGTLLGDTYRIVRRIGSGGMGEVYEATHERLAHRYAVKFLHPGVREHPEALRRFMREAQVTSRLRHPGIVSVVDFNTLPSGVAYLVMEYLEGEPLGKILARSGPMPVSRVVDITDQLSSALTAAHLQGVVHRDMHPQNVFVMQGSGGQSERIKILDFGISKIASVSQKITGMAAVMGTPQYMSPEQAEGKTDELDAASDQFSLAAMVYELLTGRAAFSGNTLASVAYQVVHATVAPLHSFRPELPRELENVVARGMAKNKQDRFPSVSEFAVHLRWTASLPSSPLPAKATLDENDATPVAADIEETTAVSALPSGMAAVLRQTTGGFGEPPIELADHTPNTTAPARAATPAAAPNTTLGQQNGESADAGARRCGRRRRACAILAPRRGRRGGGRDRLCCCHHHRPRRALAQSAVGRHDRHRSERADTAWPSGVATAARRRAAGGSRSAGRHAGRGHTVTGRSRAARQSRHRPPVGVARSVTPHRREQGSRPAGR